MGKKGYLVQTALFYLFSVVTAVTVACMLLRYVFHCFFSWFFSSKNVVGLKQNNSTRRGHFSFGLEHIDCMTLTTFKTFHLKIFIPIRYQHTAFRIFSKFSKSIHTFNYANGNITICIALFITFSLPYILYILLNLCVFVCY